MHTNVTWKTTVSRPKNRAEDSTNCQKNQKKIVIDVLKDPKTSLACIRVAHNAFFCIDRISRGTVRRILEKYGVFSRNCAKQVSLKKKSKCFRSKWCINMLRKPFNFWQNLVFTDEIMVRIFSDGIVSFSKKRNEISFKKYKKFKFGQTIAVLVCNTIRWKKIACYVSKQANRCRLFGILKNYEEKKHFLDIIFQQDNAPVHKSKIIGFFSKKTSGKY